MKIIAITGNSGSGKTTITDMFDKNPRVGVIHVDDLVGKAKLKYFRPFIERKDNKIVNCQKGRGNNPKIKSSVKAIFYKDKRLFNILMGVRERLIRKDIEKLLEEYRISRKDLVVIDDWAIETQKGLLKKLDEIYYVKRNFLARRDSLRKRDNVTCDELKIFDGPYSKRFLNRLNDTNVLIIDNNGSKEELAELVKTISEKHVEKSFDEKYKVDITRGDYIYKAASKVKDLAKERIRAKTYDD